MRATRRTMALMVTVLIVFSASIIGWAEDEPLGLRSEEWREQFSAAVNTEVARVGLLGRAADLTLELLDAEPLPEDPAEAARYVVSLAVRAEVWLRKGLPEPMVRLMLSRQIALSASQGRVSAHELAAPRRLRGGGKGAGPAGPNGGAGSGNPDDGGPWRGGRE